MGQNLTKIKRYRINPALNDRLLLLPKYGRNESEFVREAIQEKIDRDLTKLKIEYTEKLIEECPF